MTLETEWPSPDLNASQNLFSICPDWFLTGFFSVLNESSQEELSIRDVRILPNLNASYLPMMPDGSVLLVDNVWYVMGSRVSSRVKGQQQL